MKDQQYLDGYRDAMLWANAYNEHCESIDARDIEPEPYVDTTDALAFLEDNREALASLVESGKATWEQHGQDFALTRNGHGAGFWDRGYGEVGQALTDAARVYGEAYAEVWS